ncbi:lysophosphatidic acid receptor 5b [Polymixia lowei]
MSNITSSGPEPQLAYALVFGCVVVLGLPLNAVSLWTLIRRHSLKSPSAVFMINLALSDLLLVISLPMRAYFYATGSWPLGIFACVWITMLFRNNIRSSSIFITFISLDRLLAVVYPLRSRHLRTTSNAWRTCALIWLFILAMSIPESIDYSRIMHDCNSTACFELPGCKYRSEGAYLQSALVFTLLAVNVLSTAMVSRTLHRHLNDSVTVNNKMNVMLIFAVNLLMFIIFFLPYSLARMLDDGREAIMPTVCLASVNCCLDPLLYYFSLDAFWKKREHVESSLAIEQYVRTRETHT